MFTSRIDVYRFSYILSPPDSRLQCTFDVCHIIGNNSQTIAALHYNEKCNRDQATTKDGQQCFNTCYPKKGTQAVAKPRRTPPPSFG
jgi:hypothetical protein